MDEERYRTICGRRIAVHIQSQTYQNAWGTFTMHLYSGNSTEPLCFGHQEAQLTGGLKDVQRMCKTTRGTRVPVDVPQAFYEAFRDEELEL